MDHGYFRRFADRCRELMGRTHSETAKEQLSLWADEFDARADALDTDGASDSAPGYGPQPEADSDDRPCHDARR
ncbi:MAG: hypothetical protein ACM3JG_11630 [Thiohalocapsa sp.]